MAVRLTIAPKVALLYSAASKGFQVQTFRQCLGSVHGCHGDSSGKSGQWHVTDEHDNRTVMLSKFPSGIPAERRDIILELNKVIHGRSANIEARHGIQSRLETLESLGCSLDDVQANPDILLLTEKEVIRRVLELRKSHFDVNVHSIKAADRGKKKRQRKKAANLGMETWMLEICELLECSHSELSVLLDQCPTLNIEKNAENITEKIKLFLQEGLTVDNIKENLFILNRSLKNTSRLLDGIRCIRHGLSGSIDQSSVKLFLDSEWSLQNSKSKSEDSVKLKQRLLAELFQVSVSYIQDLGCSNVRLETIIKKTVFLINLGIDKRDLLNHFYLLRHSLQKLEKGVKDAGDSGITNMTAVTLVNVIQHRYVPPRHGKSRHRSFISALLNISASELKSLGQHVLPVFSVDKVVLKINTEYLLSRGFSADDIKQCLLIISHDPDVLVEYVESLSERPEFQPYEEHSRDKAVLINAVQYLIERDSNFNCKEQMGGGKATTDDGDKDLDDSYSLTIEGDNPV